MLDQPSHRGLWNLVAQLNAVYRDNPQFWALDNDPAGFEWLDGSDAAGNVLAFLRKDADGSPIAVLLNFAGNPHGDYRVCLPFAGEWEELLNTDAEDFGGSGVGNFGGVTAHDEPWMGRPASAVLTLPLLGALYLRPRRP